MWLVCSAWEKLRGYMLIRHYRTPAYCPRLQTGVKCRRGKMQMNGRQENRLGSDCAGNTPGLISANHLPVYG